MGKVSWEISELGIDQIVTLAQLQAGHHLVRFPDPLATGSGLGNLTSHHCAFVLLLSFCHEAHYSADLVEEERIATLINSLVAG